MKSAIVKRSIVVHGHKTSISLENDFWQVLREIAKSREMTLSDLVGYIDGNRVTGNLSSTIRLFVLEYARARLAAQATQGRPPVQPAVSNIG